MQGTLLEGVKLVDLQARALESMLQKLPDDEGVASGGTKKAGARTNEGNGAPGDLKAGDGKLGELTGTLALS